MTTYPYTFTYDVHIFDTDCYGVVWHGSYTKWLEMGRVDLFKSIGLDMKEASDKYDIIFPVTEQNIRFKAPSRFGDRLKLVTKVKTEPPRLIFCQEIYNEATGRLIIESKTDVVMINAAGRMYRQYPGWVEEKLNNNNIR